MLLLVSLAAAPFGLGALAAGQLLPFVVAVLGLAAGTAALALHQRAQHAAAATVQTGVMLAAGGLLVTADLGLALALLAPVQAALLGLTGAVVARCAAAAIAILAAGLALRLGWLPLPRGAGADLAGALAFAVAALVTAEAAWRQRAAAERHGSSGAEAYRHLVEHVQDAVLRFNAEGGVQFASRATEALLGCRRYELGGGRLLERIHLLDRPAFLTAFAAANRDGSARRVEIRMRRDDADAPAGAPQFIWVEAALSPLPGTATEAGRHEVVGLLRDVTARRDQEAALERERRLAEEASRAKSRFLATIGHELRTPLNAIVGFSEMMTSGIAGEMTATQQEYAGLIHKSGMHLIEVVQMLLDMSRLEAGRFDLQAERFEPAALVEPCLGMVEALAREKRVRIATEIQDGLPAIVADERACRQILINLLSNAIKFSAEGAVVTLALRRQGRHLAISVADSGIGMSPEAVARIGEPFFQAEDGLARRHQGTGLGLSIVKGLVDLHGGRLSAVSAPGEGTTMSVLLPVNGPAIKVVETIPVTSLNREPVPQPMPTWHEERKRAL